jgi:type II restriction/modification system DNA methylase subunit YeeA
MPRNELDNGSAKAQQEYKMNTKNLKAYAPKARSQFIEAIKKRAAQFGLYQDKIVEMQSEGSSFIIEGRAFSQKQGQQRQQLERKINGRSEVTHTERYNLFIREMAYTWFNRLVAIRYMELHDYLDHGFRVLSNPNSPESLPEIIGHASDVIDSLDPDKKYLDKNHIIELQLAGNKEEELYRELLLGQCHRLYNIMPFMFEAIDDATELLLPGNLTKTDSILKGLVNNIPEEDWSEIEVIGWLYQFYISEHKDAVIGKVVKSEDIPAATQLFTPNWIVKYLVQNSLGRKWLATYPESDLKDKMEYYIVPAEQSDDVVEQLKTITPTSIDPETIKVLDPAAGSGHILVEVYEVLREIYLERGYRLREIPELILTKNIYGLDIDDRAAQLAGFALMMKAREDDRRIFQRVEDGEVTLNVYSLQSTEGLDIDKLWQALNLEGNQKQGSTAGIFAGLDDEPTDFVQPTDVYREYFELLQTILSLFLQAKTFGSLIHVNNEYLQTLVTLKELLQTKEKGSDPSAKQAASEILPIVKQAIVLAQQYDVVVANPPYMGSKGMNSELKSYTKSRYPDSKSDLFSVYIEQCLKFANTNGELGMVTPFVWMFLKSYELLRKKILKNNTINSLTQLEYNAFAPACIPVCTFTISKKHINNYTGGYIRLSDFKGHENQPVKTLYAIKNRECGWFHENKPDHFTKIPGSPIAYWISNQVIDSFKNSKLGDYCEFTGSQNKTAKDEMYVRCWHEISVNKFSAFSDTPKWVGYFKGGTYRKYYGNQEYVVDWSEQARSFYKKNSTSNLLKEKFWFKQGITYSDVTSGKYSARKMPEGFIYATPGPAVHIEDNDTLNAMIAVLNSRYIDFVTKIINPTLHFNIGDALVLPVSPIEKYKSELSSLGDKLITAYKEDWNSFEESWDFKCPLTTYNSSRLKSYVTEFITRIAGEIEYVLDLEKEVNQLVTDGFNLESAFSLVERGDVTLKRNLEYYHSKNFTEAENIELQKSSINKQIVSYSVGCFMGRYSLDREGLVYAHSRNDGFKELVAEGAYKSFPADDDGIVPLASEDWLFGDDATARFREFVKTVWGDEHLQENLEFVAESLCLHALKPAKGESANDTVRRYFSKQFYKDHCKTYKKRPIYWLFSSGKEKAFECLVYLHRYNEGTLARMRTEYVTPLMGKYDQQQSMLSEQIIEASNTERRQIEKDLKSLEKKQTELRTFDEQLKHYAEMRITLDLDDGVKANYGKFGNLLADVKTIHGTAPKVAK